MTPARHISFLHKSYFMALSHTVLLQTQTAGFILVYYRHLHMSQALLGLGFIYERNRLFQDFTSSINFPLEEVNDNPEMPVSLHYL